MNLAIQSKLTRRDKILIYFCIILVIAAGTYFFLISPMLTNKENLEERLTDLTAQADEIQANSIMHGIISEQNSEYVKAYNEAVEGFQEPLFNEETDDYLTKLLQQNNIEPSSMSISSEDGSSVQIAPYNYDADSDSSASYISVTSVQEINVSISCSGRVVDLKNLIDTLYAEEGVYISNYNYTLTSSEAQSLDAAVQTALSAQSLASMSINNPNAEASASISVVISTYDEEGFKNGLNERALEIQSALNESEETEETDEEEILAEEE